MINAWLGSNNGRKRARGVGRKKNGDPPPLNVVLNAIENAAAFTGAKPEDVIAFANCNDAGFSAAKDPRWLAISRARVYAGFALRALFEESRTDEIATMLGVKKNIRFWFAAYDANLRNNMMGWFNNDHFMAVLEKTEAFIEMEKPRHVEFEVVAASADSAGM